MAFYWDTPTIPIDWRAFCPRASGIGRLNSWAFAHYGCVLFFLKELHVWGGFEGKPQGKPKFRKEALFGAPNPKLMNTLWACHLSGRADRTPS